MRRQCSSGVEQLIRNERVKSSNLFTGFSWDSSIATANAARVMKGVTLGKNPICKGVHFYGCCNSF